MSHLLKFLLFLSILYSLFSILYSPVSAAAQIGTHLAEGDITNQILIIQMLRSHGATPPHPLTALIPLSSPTDAISALCNEMLTLTDTPVLRIHGLSLSEAQDSDITSTAQNLNSSSCPSGSIIVFGNELNRLDVELSSFTSISLAGSAYNVHYNLFKATLDTRFRLAATPLDVYNSDYPADQFAAAASPSYHNSRNQVAVCNEYDGPPHNLGGCSYFQEITGTTHLPQFRSEYGPDIFAALTPQDYIDFYSNHPPPSLATSLVPNTCGSGWLYYIEEVDKIFTRGGNEVKPDTACPEIDQDLVYVHQPSEDTIKDRYQVTCATAPDTQSRITGDLNICHNPSYTAGEDISCLVKLSDQVKHTLPNLIPWHSSEKSTQTGGQEDRNRSAPNWFNWLPRDPQTAAKTAYAPIAKLSSRNTQFTTKRAYLESVATKCSLLPPEEQSKCALPRALSNGQTEAQFFADWIESLTSLDQLDSLPQDIKTIFWNEVGFQTQEGVEFEVCYWVNYIENPTNKIKDAVLELLHESEIFNPLARLFQTKPDTDLQFIPFLCPSTGGSELDTDEQGSIDAAPRLTLNQLLPKSQQDQITLNKLNRRKQSKSIAQSPEVLDGVIPCAKDPDCLSDPMAQAISTTINRSGLACDTDPQDLAIGESASAQPTIDARFGLRDAPQRLIDLILSLFHKPEEPTIAQDIEAAIDPTKNEARAGQLAKSRSWIVQSEKFSNLGVTGQTMTQMFTPASLQPQLFANKKVYPEFVRMQSGEGKGSEPPPFEVIQWDEVIPGPPSRIIPHQVRIALVTEPETVVANLLGGPILGSIKTFAQVTLSASHPQHFLNSLCQLVDPQLECYFWGERPELEQTEPLACTIDNSGIASQLILNEIIKAADWANIPVELLIAVARKEGGCCTDTRRQNDGSTCTSAARNDSNPQLCFLTDEEVTANAYLASGPDHQFPYNCNVLGPLSINDFDTYAQEVYETLGNTSPHPYHRCNIRDSIWVAAYIFSSTSGGQPAKTDYDVTLTPNPITWTPTMLRHAVTRWAANKQFCTKNPDPQYDLFTQFYCDYIDSLVSPTSSEYINTTCN